jgi:hypothetical protein
MNGIVRPAFMLGLVMSLSGAVRAGNLLTNPGAETGNLNGWTVGGNSNPGVDDGSFDPGINPHTGTYDFYGHTGPFGTLTQNVTLSGIPGISTSLIDSGLTSAGVTFWEQGLNQGDPSDDAQVTLTFRDPTNSVIGSVSTPEIDSHDGTWQEFTGNFAIPAGTRSIDYTMDFIRHKFNDNDSFVDDNSLVVTASVPEPSGLIMIGISSLALIGHGRRHRNIRKRS